MATNKISVIVRMDPEEKAEIERLAKAQGATANSWVMLAVREKLARDAPAPVPARKKPAK